MNLSSRKTCQSSRVTSLVLIVGWW
ncbi:hypothetical protein D0D73_25610 [Vibrio parahaemolyticus]|nr:hypothetical protein [Vibrio parahaemolyticus]EGR1763047.1 hypothetical protein [Vibrio parahaemolyticus]